MGADRQPIWTGAIGIATAVPMIVFGLLGGSLADVSDRRNIGRAATILQFLGALSLMTQAAMGNTWVPLLLGLVAPQTVGAAASPSYSRASTRVRAPIRTPGWS